MERYILSSESFVSNEKLEAKFEHACDQGVRILLGEIADSTPSHIYHSSWHTAAVVDYFTEQALSVHSSFPHLMPRWRVSLGRFKAAVHDRVRTSSVSTLVEGNMRDVGLFGTTAVDANGVGRYDDEFNSARYGVLLLDALASQEGLKVSQGLRDSFFPDILATVPYYDLEKGTVVQPLASREEVSLEGKMLSLIDINSSALGNRRISGKESAVRLFWEYNPGVFAYLSAQVYENSDYENWITARYKNWMKNQISFCNGRISLLDSELERLPSSVRAIIAGKYEYNEVISSVSDYNEFIKQMPVERLIDEMKLLCKNPLV